MELEAKEPVHGAAATLGQSLEDPVTADAPILANRQLGALGTGDSRLLASEVMQQQVRQQQAGHQSHKPAITGESLKAGPVLLPEAVSQKCLKPL